jgi:hypothetical protein
MLRSSAKIRIRVAILCSAIVGVTFAQGPDNRQDLGSLRHEAGRRQAVVIGQMQPVYT